MRAILKATGERGEAYIDSACRWRFVETWERMTAQRRAQFNGFWVKHEIEVNRSDLVLLPGEGVQR